MNNSFNTIIIGGGQAGLAAGYYLKIKTSNFLILDSHTRTGDQWRKRFNGLTLFTPNSLNQLPGFGQPSSQGEFQTSHEFADYLEQYSQHFSLPIEHNQQVLKITQNDHGIYLIKTHRHQYTARNIILATGAFKDVYVPDIASSNEIKQYTINEISNVKFNDKKLLIVGDGASGRQVAKRFSKNNTVYLAQGRKRTLIREKILGINTFHILKTIGLLRLSKNTKLALWLKHKDPFPDSQINDQSLSENGVTLMPKLTHLDDKATFNNQQNLAIDAVIWASGYRNNYNFIAIKSLLDNKGQLNPEQFGINGFYYVGMPWQTSRSSGLIYGAKFDAKLVIGNIINANRSK